MILYKDTSSEERCVSVGNGGNFYYGIEAQSQVNADVALERILIGGA